jgi:chromosomal replication initiation ATPase DnaA
MSRLIALKLIALNEHAMSERALASLDREAGLIVAAKVTGNPFRALESPNLPNSAPVPVVSVTAETIEAAINRVQAAHKTAQLAAAMFGLPASKADIISARKLPHLVKCRVIVCTAMALGSRHSSATIGRMISRDHSTVIYQMQKGFDVLGLPKSVPDARLAYHSRVQS